MVSGGREKVDGVLNLCFNGHASEDLEKGLKLLSLSPM
jgi:hypothetical protein